MRRLMLAAAATIALAGGAAPAAGAWAQVPDNAAVFHATTLNLSAFGETRIAPDIATITTGVVTTHGRAAEAMRLNRERMTAVVAALRAAGIAERDIQTSSLTLDAQYVYPENQQRRLTGYQASNLVTITVRDLPRLGATVDAVVSSGANEINGIAFDIANPQAAEDAARRAAVKALEAKAALYAGATGHRVSRLVSLSESGGYTPAPPRPMVMMRMQAEAASTPVQPGELRVRVDVQAVYELAK